MDHGLLETDVAKVRNAKELGAEIERGADMIEIEGDLARRVIRIRATGRVAWLVAFGAIGLAAGSYLFAPTPAAPAALAMNPIP